MDDKKYDEESCFRLLYFTYINKKLTENNLSADNLSELVENIRCAFHFGEGGRALNQFDLNQEQNAYAYFNRFGPLASGLVRQRILEAFSAHDQLRSKITHPQLKIVNLGSGPGTDVVGFCSAVWQMFQREPAAPQCERLDFTLVDYIKNWKRMSRELEHLIREDDYGFVSRMFETKEINMKFLLVNLDSHPERYEIFLSKMKKADIILVVRILQHLDNRRQFLEMIYDYTDDNVTVVFIEPKYFMDRILEGQNMFEMKYEHPSDGPEGVLPENFFLDPCDRCEPFPEYRRNICTNSNNRVFVLEKIKRKEDK